MNLTIAAPTSALGDVKKELPVMVYIHGGAFRVGGGHVDALHGEFLGFGLLGIAVDGSG